MFKIVIPLSLLFSISAYAYENNIYMYYVDKCMNQDPSDFEYCQCIGKCMYENTDENDRQYFEKDWFDGQCRFICDNWYNNYRR